GGGDCLDKKNLSTSCCRTIQACNQDTAQKEHLHAGVTCAETQTPEQTGSQEAVVQPLARSQNLGGGCGLLRLAEGSQPCGFVPEEHLEHQDVDVQERDESDNNIGNSGHSLSLSVFATALPHQECLSNIECLSNRGQIFIFDSTFRFA